MAANMQNMANAGHLMAQQQQQQRSKVSAQIASHVYQYLAQNTPQYNGMAWQANMTISDRMGKIVEIITNISLAMPGVEPSKAVELGCQFERGHFAQAPNREEYDKIMKGKVEELFRKRQGNEANLQNSLNASARMQAQQAQQAQAMMNAQLGRGMMPQQGFPMQGMPAQMAQQQQQFLQQQQMMMMQNQAGRGVLPQGQAAMMMGGQMPQQQQQQQQQQQPQQQQQMPQQQQGAPTDMSQLSVAEKRKITEFTAKMMAETTDQQKIATRNQVRQRMNPAQLAQFQATNKDPLLWFWQNQAFQHIRATRLQQQQAQGQNQATMMQQQQSQQSLQQRQNMMANAQPGGDFTQFNNMESIKDQQLTGFMAQQAGQMVVPASNAGARNPTPQPGNQNMGPNQTPRPQQQPQPQQPNQQQVNLQQQMNMGQAQNQAQIPGQAGAMNNGMGLGQGMNPAARQQNVMGMAGTPGQRPGNAVLQAMLATMTPDQRQHLSSMPPDKVQDVVRRWQAQRQMQMAGGQMSQGAQPNQFGQMNAAMGAGVPAGAQQPINMGGPGAQQPQMQAQQRISLQGGQIQSMMDNMEIAPPLMAQMTTLLRAPIPPNIKRWKELKMWLTQNNAAPATKQSFANLQQKQFQLMMSRRVTQGQAQPVQSQPAVAMGQPGQQPGMVNQQQPQQLQQQQPQQVQQQQPQQPPQQQQPQQPGIMNGGTASQMTPQQVALMHRLMNNAPPQIMQVSPEEMMNLRAQRPNMANIPDEQLRPIVLQMKRTAWASRQVQAQAQAQAMRMRNQAGGQGPSLGPQPTATQPDAIINNQPPQTTQNTQTAATTKAPVATPTPKPTPSITPITPHQHAAKVKLQANKNLKRPSTDDLEDGSSSQVGKVTPQPIKQLAPDQLAKLSPEERAKYELHLKSQLARNTASAQYDKETMDRLKVIGAEEQRAFSPDSLKEITMTPEELKETGSKLQKAGYDMNRLSKVLLRWYSAARDDSRARMFFRMRLRLLRQFQDGEKMTILKDKFSVRSSELDELRNMMDSMRRDLAMDVMSKQAQVEGTAPVSASADKTTAKTKAVKDNEAPPAPTSTQPPVQIGAPMGAHSPHGTPNYMNKAKDMNLQLPASRKKQRTQGGTVDTPSPQVAKTASPELKRVPEPPKPTFLCKEADCDAPIRAFPTEQALQHHVAEEHIKPREEPLKFLQETLAHALGLEPDGTARKDKAPAMSTSTSKQGQTPGAMGTPAVGMKRSASTASKTLSGKTAAGRADLPPRSASADPWIGATIDKQALLCNLGFEKGLPSLINDVNMLLSNTPNDTPESSKSSEPNSELSDATQIEIDQSWQHFDTDLLLNLDSAGLEALGGDGSTMDPSFLLNPTSAMSTDWNSINVDFSKPFQLDSSLYSMETL